MGTVPSIGSRPGSTPPVLVQRPSRRCPVPRGYPCEPVSSRSFLASHCLSCGQIEHVHRLLVDVAEQFLAETRRGDSPGTTGQYRQNCTGTGPHARAGGRLVVIGPSDDTSRWKRCSTPTDSSPSSDTRGAGRVSVRTAQLAVPPGTVCGFPTHFERIRAIVGHVHTEPSSDAGTNSTNQ